MRTIFYLTGVIASLGLIALACGDAENPLLVQPSEQGRLSKPAKSGVWKVPGDFATIQDAIDDAGVSSGDRIVVGSGSHAGALVTKPVEIKGEDGAVIGTGPLHPAGFSQGFRLLSGSDGATFSHLTFTTDLSIMNGEAVNDVTVTHCTFQDAVQAISNWRGSGWEISHNVIEDLRTRCGGGIGILVADFSGGVVEDNVVSHNKVSGQVNVDPDDCGGYNASGIVLYADFRFGRVGAEEIKDNRIVQNNVGLTMNDQRAPGVGNPMDVLAFELTDTRDDEDLDPVVFDNAIGFNDFRGTALQIALTPANLDEVNSISRNLGKNRGHGLHPSLFGPGGN